MFGFSNIRKLVLAGLGAAGLLAGTAASASTVTFDFGGGAGNTGSTTASYTQGGVGVDLLSTGGNISVQSGGVGVQGAPNSGRIGVGERLSFTFAPNVVLRNAVIFEAGNGTDTVQIRDGSGNILTTFVVSDTPGKLFSQDLSGLNLVGGTFEFRLLSATGTSRGFRVSSLTVATMPVPAGGVLLIVGLGGFVALRRRKRTA